jgi:hypothetical protein
MSPVKAADVSSVCPVTVYYANLASFEHCRACPSEMVEYPPPGPELESSFLSSLCSFRLLPPMAQTRAQDGTVTNKRSCHDWSAALNYPACPLATNDCIASSILSRLSSRFSCALRSALKLRERGCRWAPALAWTASFDDETATLDRHDRA